MPLKLIRQDITVLQCDAIVNPSNEDLLPGGGTDAAIHAAAGERLAAYCKKLGGVRIGEAKLSPAFDLPCRYVIHVAGPIYRGTEGEEALLASCYLNALRLAVQSGCESVAFPLISSGENGFPKNRVLRIAIDAIGAFLLEHELFVYLVVFDKTSYALSERLFSDVSAFIDDAYAEERSKERERKRCERLSQREREERARVREDYTNIYDEARYRDFCASSASYSISFSSDASFSCEEGGAGQKSLEELLGALEDGFAETLFRYIDEKGISDVECYKRSNVDKKTFSKIKCNKNYKPSKLTAVSFAIGLRLNYDETCHLLETAGLALSRSNRFDVIIEYFVRTGNYQTIHDVNETLYQFDQLLLGV